MITLDNRCDNWGYALRSASQKQTAQSYEGNYRSSYREHYLMGGAPNTRTVSDPADAAIIENAVCVLDLYHHALLRGWYVHRIDPEKVLRLAAKADGRTKKDRGTLSGFGASLALARALLGATLEQPAVFHKPRARERVLAILGPVPLPLRTLHNAAH